MDIFLPTIQKFSNPILVGHSFGGMFPLLFPYLEQLLKGFVILNSCPTLWLEEAVNYSRQFQVPDLTQEMCDFTNNPSNETFQKAIEACMPYYFPPESIEKGRELWKDVTIQYRPAVWWQKKAIEIKLDAKWIPENVPTLVLGGKYDCITPFTLFQRDKRFHRPNIELVRIEKGGHCSWIEDPDSVISAFDRFFRRL